MAVAFDIAGNMYVADAWFDGDLLWPPRFSGDYAASSSWNGRIRKMSPAGVVSTLADSGSTAFADGTVTDVSFGTSIGLAGDPGPLSGLAVDSSGNVYVTDKHNNRIHKVSPTGTVTTLAGSGSAAFADGTGTGASFNGPSGVALDSAGNVYVADTFNGCIRKVSSAGVVTTLAGSADGFWQTVSVDGTGADASFCRPRGVAVDSAGNVYVADSGCGRIRKMSPAGVVITLAGIDGGSGGADGFGWDASFDEPYGVAVDSGGDVYVADSGNNRVRKIVQTYYDGSFPPPPSPPSPSPSPSPPPPPGPPLSTLTCAAGNDATQCAALRDLYFATNGPSWRQDAYGWTVMAAGGAPDYCTFSGVFCYGNNVTQLCAL
jgi:sugar lactone lactonase YvrE